MPTNLSTGTTADILLVAGGGGGGSNMGGGGGAGGTTATSQYLNFNTYNITVGAGGSGAPAGGSSVRGNNGTDSMIISTSTTATYSIMFQTGQSLTPGTNASFAYTGDFTVEGWIYRLATGDASMIVQGTSPYFGINVNAGTGINVYLNNATANLVVTNRIPAIQTWNHIALVRSSGIVKVYLNGVPSTTTASNVTTLGFSASNLYIGANNVTGGANQYISNVRITNGTALYTNTFTVSTTPLTPVTDTVLLACSSSTYTKDFSTSSASLIASGVLPGSPFTLLWTPFNSTFTTVGGGGGGSDYVNPTVSIASFGGSGGGAQGGAGSLFGLGITGQGNSGVASIGNHYASGGGGATSVGASVATGNVGGTGLASSILGTTYYWGGGGGGSGYSNLSGNGGAGGGGGGAPLSGGSVSGTGGGYGNIQGINPGADAIAGTLLAVTNKAGGNGGTNTGGGGGGGSHRDTTNAGGTGGSGAVVIRYVGPQRGTGGTIYSYTVGTTLYTAHAFFTSAIFTLHPFPLYAQANGGQGGPYGGGGGGASSWYGAIVNNGAVTSITSATVYYGSFNGTNQYLSISTNAALNFGTGDFTVEAWVNTTAANVGDFFIITSTGSAGGFFVGYNSSVASYGWGVTGSTWDYSTGATKTNGVWQHIAVSRSGTNMRIFVNGVQAGTTQLKNTAYNLGVTSTVVGWQSSSYYFPGFISNLRVVKGVAVYTGNFTVSLSDLSTTQSSVGNIAAITGSQTSLLTLKNATIIDNSTYGLTITNVNAVTIASTTTSTVSVSYPIASNVSWIGTGGGMGANGSASNNAGCPIQAGGGGGGVSTTAASGGGGGVDVYGITTSSNYIIFGGSANNPGSGGAKFNLGGQPGTGGNGGLYGGGGAGAAVSSVDTNTGNGAGGALLIVYNTTASTNSYPSIMPVLSNSVGAASSTLLTFSSTTNKLLLTQFDNIVTSYQGLQYETLNTGNLVNYNNVDINVAKTFLSQSIVAGSLQVITYITDHEMMLKNSDPTLPATYNTPGNYQVIQEIRPDNDPRLITVRVQNFVTGVTGSDGSPVVSVTAGGQVWF